MNKEGYDAQTKNRWWLATPNQGLQSENFNTRRLVGASQVSGGLTYCWGEWIRDSGMKQNNTGGCTI